MSHGAPHGGFEAISGPGCKDAQVLPLHKEDVAVSKRVRKTLVRATRKTRTRDAYIEEGLRHNQVIVERVACNKVVEVVPPVRQEGDVTIFSVVEEVLVVERRLVVTEEVHLRRVQRQERHVEKVTLRGQSVTVSRTDIEVD